MILFLIKTSKKIKFKIFFILLGGIFKVINAADPATQVLSNSPDSHLCSGNCPEYEAISMNFEDRSGVDLVSISTGNARISQKSAINWVVPVLNVVYESDKQVYFNEELIKRARNFCDFNKEGREKTKILKKSIKNKLEVSCFLSTKKHNLLKSLAPEKEIFNQNPLQYNVLLINPQGELPFFISESTLPVYDYDDPKAYCPQQLDFYLLVATNFGMSTVVFGLNGEILNHFMNYGNTHYAIGYSKEHSVFFRSIISKAQIDCVSFKTFKTINTFKGYAVTAIYIQGDDLYFAGYLFDNENSSAIYRYNILNHKVEEMLTQACFINDIRGLIVLKNELYFSETFNHQIIHYDRQNKRIIRRIKGFHFPNKITLSSCKEYVFVADEHNDTVRKCRLHDFKEVERTPFGLCTSPAVLKEISKGIFKGFYLIADTDGNRVILVNPKKEYEILAEFRGLRSCMDIDVAYSD